MLGIHAASHTVGNGGTCDIAIAVFSVFNHAVSIVNVGLVDIDQTPVPSTQVVAFVFEGRLSKHHTNRVLAKDLVIGQGVLYLPQRVIAFVDTGTGVLSTVVTRQIIIGGGAAAVAIEGEVGAIGEVVLQVVPELQVESKLGHELM